MSLDLGYYGERNARTVKVPMINRDMWPDATPQIIVFRPDKKPYLVTASITESSGYLLWSIKPEDVCVMGVGSAQVQYVDANNDVLGMDPVLQTVIGRSIDQNTVVLDPYEPEIQRLINAAATATTSANAAAASAEAAQESADSVSKVNITVSKTGDTATVTATDRDGTVTTAQINDGERGDSGVAYSTTEPTDSQIQVWINPAEKSTLLDEIANKINVVGNTIRLDTKVLTLHDDGTVTWADA